MRERRPGRRRVRPARVCRVRGGGANQRSCGGGAGATDEDTGLDRAGGGKGRGRRERGVPGSPAGTGRGRLRLAGAGGADRSTQGRGSRSQRPPGGTSGAGWCRRFSAPFASTTIRSLPKCAATWTRMRSPWAATSTSTPGATIRGAPRNAPPGTRVDAHDSADGRHPQAKHHPHQGLHAGEVRRAGHLGTSSPGSRHPNPGATSFSTLGASRTSRTAPPKRSGASRSRPRSSSGEAWWVAPGDKIQEIHKNGQVDFTDRSFRSAKSGENKSGLQESLGTVKFFGQGHHRRPWEGGRAQFRCDDRLGLEAGDQRRRSAGGVLSSTRSEPSWWGSPLDGPRAGGRTPGGTAAEASKHWSESDAIPKRTSPPRLASRPCTPLPFGRAHWPQRPAHPDQTEARRLVKALPRPPSVAGRGRVRRGRLGGVPQCGSAVGRAD